MKDNEHFDVVICGGGNAGLLMARQLQLHSSPRSILVLDKGSDNAPPACHKVGESIAEGAAYHLRHTLELNDYLFGCHVPKFGFRFFFGGGETPFAERLEYGGTQWPPFATFQLDRGVFENDLRRMVTEQGAIVLTEASIKTIEISSSGPHRVNFERCGSKYTVRGEWLIDATGRHRLLAKKLALNRSVDHKASASWMRFDRRIDIEELVGREQTTWHDRVGPPRWFSTVHLAGAGYWVWIIPLREGRTSVGIVGDENIHPVIERNSPERMLSWCLTHEPGLARLLEQAPILDFGAIRNFGIGCSQAFSHERWSVIGDAAVFPDPLYAFGQDLIAHGISITALLIDLDDNGLLSESVVDSYNRMFLTMFDLLLDHFRGAYPILGNPFVYSQKLAWDSSLYFAILQQTLTQNIYDRRDAAQLMMRVFERLMPLNRAMQSIFRECHERAGPLDIYRGMRTWAPRVAQFADSSLDKSPSSALADFFAQRLNHLEGIATAIFGNILQRSGTVAYELASTVLDTGAGLNPSAASLQPERWQNDGLFDVTRSKPDFDRPAEWDVHNRISAERAKFQPIAPCFRTLANEIQDRIALIDGPKTISYGQLLRMVERLSEKITQQPSGFATVETNSVVRAAVTMLAMLCASRHFTLFSSCWSEEETASAVAACNPTLRVSDKVFKQLARFDCQAEIKNYEYMRPAADAKFREQCFFKPALRDIRFNRFGMRDVVLDHAALFRMRDWLARLIQVGLDPVLIDQPLRCAWVGMPRYEILVPLTSGCTLLVPADRVGADLLVTIERCNIDVIFGEPDQLSALVAAGWPNRPLRVVSIGDPLPDSLLRLLRERADRVCDFGYATFAH